MARAPVRLHPHLFDPNAANSSPFRSPLSVPREFRLAPVNRAQHAATLKRRLEETAQTAEQRVQEQQAAGIDGGHGIVLQFEGATNFGELYSSLPFLTFRLPFRLFDLIPHLRGGDPLVLGTVGEDAAGDRVEGFQDFGHAIRAL